MNQVLEVILNYLIPILGTILTAVLSYIGVQIKTCVQKGSRDRELSRIVTATVKYVEQITKNTDMTGAEKFIEAKEKILVWLHEQNIKASDTELDILIESAVKELA